MSASRDTLTMSLCDEYVLLCGYTPWAVVIRGTVWHVADCRTVPSDSRIIHAWRVDRIVSWLVVAISLSGGIPTSVLKIWSELAPGQGPKWVGTEMVLLVFCLSVCILSVIRRVGVDRWCDCLWWQVDVSWKSLSSPAAAAAASKQTSVIAHIIDVIISDVSYEFFVGDHCQQQAVFTTTTRLLPVLLFRRCSCWETRHPTHCKGSLSFIWVRGPK